MDDPIQRLKPLAYPPGFPEPPTLLHKILMWIPILGWTALKILQDQERDKCIEPIEEELARRGSIPRSIWPDELRAEVAEEVLCVINDELMWPNPNFIPDDPLRIMIELDTGDLCEIEAIMGLEEAFKVELLKRGKFTIDPETSKEVTDMTFSEFVEYVIRMSPRFKPRH